MQQYTLPYGREKLMFSLPDTLDVTVIKPVSTQAAPDPMGMLRAALDNPVSDNTLSNILLQNPAACQVAIAINDKTRPVPHKLMLPPLLAHLQALGVPAQAITLIIATGTHTPATEFGTVVPPEILAHYHVISHDCDADDLVHCGTTSRGTPVWINQHFATADVRIVVGNIEPHHFAGFSGGVKSAAIGLAGRATITANHSLLGDSHATLARYEDNPLRQDIEDIGELADVHFAFNVVMNSHKQIVAAFAGQPRTVMQAAIPVVRQIYEVPIDKPFDLLITSPGGYPKDINLYQAHKAVTPTFHVTRKGGGLILLAACEEGIGHTRYAQWMQNHAFTSHEDVLKAFAEEPFQLGPHKAFLFARQASQLRGIWIVSDVAADEIKRLLLNPATLPEALSAIIPSLPTGARVGIIPYANATIPVLRTEC